MAGISKRASGAWVSGSERVMKTATDIIVPPTTIYADGTNATLSIKGNMVQSGSPTPDIPIQPSECGERTENLCSVANWSNSTTDTRNNFQAEFQFLNGSTLVATSIKAISSVGRYSLTTTTQSAFTRLRLKHNGSTADIVIYSQSGNWSNGATLTISFNVIGYNPTVSGGISLEQIMLNYGSTALPYEPYGQYKIPISSANTTTPVYLGEVQTTRKVKKLVLTGQEDWAAHWSSNSLFTLSTITDYMHARIANLKCSHYVGRITVNGYSEVGNLEIAFYYNAATPTVNELYIRNDNISGATAFKDFLAQQYAAGTPVTVWYVLATETTGIVNEPIRKIGDYADAVSGITIPTIAGADTLSIGTTLQPSEVTANYRGWHEGTVKDYENGGWQPQAQDLSLSNSPMLSMAIPDIDEPIPVIEPEIESEITE